MGEARLRTVLVVDDDEDNRKILMFRLRRIRINGDRPVVMEASDGIQAIAALVEHTPDLIDLIIMDLHMPNMDGEEATQRIRALESYAASVPIIIVSAETPDSNLFLRSPDVSDNLVKPLVDPEVLEKKICFWVDRRHATADAQSIAPRGANI